ncbi:uncharacterized protein METZ01_LOCUS450222, partial [marine metagenome]
PPLANHKISINQLGYKALDPDNWTFSTTFTVPPPGPLAEDLSTPRRWAYVVDDRHDVCPPSPRPAIAVGGCKGKMGAMVTDTPVLVGLGLYVLIMLGIGLYASRKVRGAADFIVAGKRLSLVLCTGTLAATWFGAGLCIGAASAAYSGGMMAVVPDPFGAALCLFLAGLFYVRLMRRMGLMTVASFFTSRFDGRAGLLASLCTIPAYVGWVAALMVAFGRILQSIAGLDPTIGILVAAAVVLAYTFAGGMWAVTLT